MSTVTAVFASTAGWRNGMPVTSTPPRKRRARQQHGEGAPPELRASAPAGAQRVEVVVDPADLEDVELVTNVPELGQLGPGAIGLCGCEGELRHLTWSPVPSE